MNLLEVLAFILAVVCFLVSAIGWSQGRIDMVTLGLLFVALGLLAGVVG